MKPCETTSCEFLLKYYTFIIAVIFTVSVVFVINVIAMGKSYASYVTSQMKYNVYEYNEVDIEQLCRISNCAYVIKDGKTFISQKNEKGGLWIARDKETVHTIQKLFDNYHISNTFDIIIYVDCAQAYFALNLSTFYSELKLTYIFTFSLILLISISFLYFSYNREQKDHILQTIGSEAILANQSMVMITENVHHELNTPLEVIDNKIEKIHRTITDYLIGLIELQKDTILESNAKFIALNRSLVNMEQDFNFIKISSEQIYSVLDKMKGFKHLRYSNGNKTLYDICEGALKIINISNSGFSYKIDSNLKDYRIKHNGDKTLKNVDLLNVILNHLKNSLEAKASMIELKMYTHKDDILKLHIVDNGNGIPKEAVNKVFLPNFSTKKELKAIRGNGMYLNKFIMEACDGGISIVDSSSNGTIIELKILSKFHEYRIF